MLARWVGCSVAVEQGAFLRRPTGYLTPKRGGPGWRPPELRPPGGGTGGPERGIRPGDPPPGRAWPGSVGSASRCALQPDQQPA